MVYTDHMTKGVEKAILVLKSGGVVVFGTETAYAIGCDARDDHAVEKIMQIKGREAWKTPALIAADCEMVEREVQMSEKMRDLVKQFWPGPLTIVALVRAGSTLSPLVVREGTVAIRVSSDSTARKLSKALNAPVVSTSANVSGEASCYSLEDVRSQLGTQLPQPDFFIDVGSLPVRPASTIIKEENGEFIVIRKGQVDLCNVQKNSLDKIG